MCIAHEEGITRAGTASHSAPIVGSLMLHEDINSFVPPTGTLERNALCHWDFMRE